MKKLFTLFIFLCAALSASADNHKIYLIPGVWDDVNATEVFAAWVCGANNGLSDKWVTFTDTGCGFYTAEFEDGYTKIVLGRFGSDVEIKWDNQWNQSSDITYNSATPVYTFNSWGDATQSALYKLYVKNMESNANVNIDSWHRGNNYFEWPGIALETETVDGAEWNVFEWPLSSIDAYFTLQDSAESNHMSGGEGINLTSMPYYYYWPSLHEHILRDNALAEPATLYFRIDEETFDASKRYIWNNSGLNADLAFKEVEYKDYTWKKVETHKPSFSIQFYTGDGGNEDYTKTDGLDVSCTSGETSYYVLRKAWHGNSKLDSEYYIIDTDNANGGNSLGNTKMEEQGNFIYKAVIDNVTDNKYHYFEIAPASCLNNGEVSDWANLIYSNYWDNNGNKQPCAISDFKEQADLETMIGRDNGYNRWQLSEAYKYEIYYNAATARLTVIPYFERTLPAEAEGYATFSSNENVAIPGDITAAMYPSAVSPTGAITWTEFTSGIPAGQGALLQGVAGKSYKFTPAKSLDAVSGDGNITMEPIDAKVAEQPLPQIDGDFTNYILWKSSDVLGFFKVNSNGGTWVNAGTAYLKVKLPKEDSSDPSDPSTAPAFFPLTGETTAIDNLTTEPAAKGEEKIYSLDGRRIVGQPTAKGIYIVNGKKLLKK